MLDTLVQTKEELTQHARQLSKDEVGLLITLFRLTDKWPTDVASHEQQKSHAQVLRWHLHSLFEYYFERGQENKAKLAVTLYSATAYAEHHGLTHTQIAAIQSVLTYFQRVAPTLDDLRACSTLLWNHDIFTMPEMPNWQTAIADH